MIKDGIIQGDNIFGVPFKYDPVKTSKKRYPMKATTTTVHGTGNKNADEHDHTEYVDHVKAYVDWHFTVGDEIIYQELPITMNAWHAGDGGSGQGNRTSIAIEIDEEGDIDKAIRNCHTLLFFLKTYEPSLKKDFIRKHQDWKSGKYPNGKYCPAFILNGENGWSWNRFMSRYMIVESELSATQFEDIKGHWAEPQLKRLIHVADLKGYPDGTLKPDEPLSLARLATILEKLKLI